MASFSIIKKAYDDFIAGGGHPSSIAKASDDASAREIYRLVSVSRILGDDGNQLPIAEKFKYFGIPFRPQRVSNGDMFSIIKTMLDSFVVGGGDVSTLKKTDSEYIAVKNFKMVVDGRRLTLEEKFSELGHPRKHKNSKDVKEDLLSSVLKFLAEGGNIYMPKKKLPFYSPYYKSYAAVQRKNGVVGDLAFQTNMRSIGIDYSEMFYQYGKVIELAKFKDVSGYVDSYRQNSDMSDFIKISSYKLGLPIPVFVGLVGNYDLRGCYLDTDYFSYVRKELAEYLKEHDNFVGLSKIDKPLYERVKHIKALAFTPEGIDLTTDDVLCLLGFDGVKSDFDLTTGQSDLSAILGRLRIKASKNGGKLSRRDIPEGEYRKLVSKIAATGATTSAFFKLYEIDYDGKESQRLGKVWVDKYPFMKEMRRERDRLLAEHGVSVNGNCKKEDLFDVLINASVQAFEAYKSLILNSHATSSSSTSKNNVDKIK